MAVKKGIYVINGVERVVRGDHDRDTLAAVLRRIGLTSVKIGCGVGQCGVCTVLLDGKPVRACIKKYKDVPEGSSIETVEGLGTAGHLHPLQLAWIKYGGVQCGFCTPGFIMSAKGLLDVEPSPTRQQVRDWFTKNHNLCRCTGYKPLVDAVMAAAAVLRGEQTRESLVYTTPPDGKVYNTWRPRPTALAKVLGACDFGHDLGDKMPPGSLHMAVTWSKYAHADILGVDVSEAEKMPGVDMVLTADNIPGTNQVGSVIRHLRSKAHTVALQVLNDKKVRRLGDPIAIVLADTEDNARAAADQVKVDYAPLPVYSSYLESCRPGAVSIIGDCPNVMVYQPVIKGADTREIFARAQEEDSGIYSVEGSFHSSRQPHLSLEPWSLQAFYDEDGNLTINDKTQALYVGKLLLPTVLGIEPGKLRWIENPTGASFGAGMAWDASAMIGAAAIAAKKPVTWTMNYGESQRFTGKRAASFTNARIACDSQGKLQAIEADIAMDHGCNASSAGHVELKTIRFIGYPYYVPNIRALTRSGISNQPYGVPYRAYGSPQVYTAIEQLMDMLAEKMGMDPLELRYINAAQPGETAPYGALYTSYPVREMLDSLRPFYQESLQWAQQPPASGIKRGVGISCGGYHVSTPNDKAEVALELNPDGTITHYNSWAAQGQGADIGTLVHTYEALKPLGVRVEDIRLYQNDSKFCPATGPAAGSRSHYMAGNATIDAANKLMDAMRKPDGSYRTCEEMAAENIPTRYVGVFSTLERCFTNLNADTGQGDPTPDCNFLATVSRVEVEEDTGKTRVIAVHSVSDVGVVGNYLALEGQAFGGLMHSIGFALSEDYYDETKKYGTPLGCGFPRCNDIPDEIPFTFLEHPRETGPQGSGGAAECFQSSAHVSILNAIYNAVGVRIHEIPALPEKVKAAMEAKAAGQPYGPEKYYLGEDFYTVLEDIMANPVEKGTEEITEEEIAKAGH